MNAEALNDRMVDVLVQRGVISDSRVERAFRTVRRHWFLPETPLQSQLTKSYDSSDSGNEEGAHSAERRHGR